MKNLLCFSLLFLLLSCQSDRTFAEQSMTLEGEISGYQYDEHIISLKKGDVLNANVSSSIIDVVIYSPINTTLEMGQPMTITQSGDYVFRVLLPRAFARRNDTQRYQLKINIQSIID